MKKNLTLFCLSILFIGSTFSQNKKVERYTGALKIPDEVEIICDHYTNLGTGHYDYYLNKASDRVKHGEFRFTSNKTIYDKAFVINGHFSNGLKNGQWTIRQMDTKKGKYEDEKYYISLIFRNDSLNGRYKIISPDGGSDAASFLSSAFSGDGKKLKFDNESGVIKNNKISPDSWQYNEIIKLDNNSLPHGLYKIIRKSSSGIQYVHERYYHHGNIIYICETDESTGKTKFYYKIYENIQRPIKRDMFVDTILDGQPLTYYEGKFYQSKSFVFNYSTMDEMEVKTSPSDFVPKLIKKILPSICSGWDNTLVQTTRNINNTQEKDDCVYSVVDQQPEFIGGEQALYKYLANNIKYPSLARENGIMGKVNVTFIVNTDGSISDVRIIRDIGGGCGDEAIRVVKNMPKWKPGVQNGKPVRVKYTMPIIFDLK